MNTPQKEFDRAQFDEYYRRYAPLLLRCCLRYVKNRPEAEDITHSVFVNAMKTWNRFRGNCSPYTWFYRAATNLCLNSIRDRSREVLMHEDAIELLCLDCRDDFDAPFKRIIVREMLSGFCTVTRRIVFLASFERLAQEEIAEVLGISRNTVQKKWNNFLVTARKRCREVV